MTDQEIRHLYDSNLNLTLKQLARLTGKPIAKLKRILLR
jgi:hypothetical protein